MKGWPHESARHSLSSRGIRTRAITNPIASEKYYDPKRYGPASEKGERKFSGSGLDKLNEDKVIKMVNDIVETAHDIAASGEKSPIDEKKRYDYPIEVTEIYIVGSRVSGFHTESSDLDVYVVIQLSEDVDVDEEEYAIDIIDALDEAYAWMDMDIEGSYIEDENGNSVKVDIFWNWKPPDAYEPDRPALLIWEAPS